MKIRNIAGFIMAIAISISAQAKVTVTDAWVQAIIPGQTTTAAYLDIKSDVPAKLVAVSSPVASYVQIHEVTVHNNVMHMRPIDAIDLVPGKTVELKPGSYHIMMGNITKFLRPGATTLLFLTVESADRRRHSIEVEAEIRSAIPMEKPDDMKGMGTTGGMKGM